MKKLYTLKINYLKNKNNKIITQILSKKTINNATQQKNKKNKKMTYVIKPLINTTNQYNTGNCWIHAGLNLLRNHYITYYNLDKNFELSVLHLYFYHKYEKCLKMINSNNYYKIEDGGDWNIFKYLIKKYGIVPKTLFKENKNFKNTENLNNILNLIMNDCIDKNIKLQKIYNVLCNVLGTPIFPNENIKWKKKIITPLKFYNNFMVKLENYIEIKINDYTLNYLLLSCIKSLKCNEKIMIVCNVDYFHNLKQKTFDFNNYNYELLFDYKPTNKTFFMDENSLHAMNIIGVNLKNNLWLVENSWNNKDSLFLMSNDWFKKFGNSIIINKKYLC